MSVYMVFPYMDHDLAGLLENERVKLSPSQIKLYMKQLLEGTEYMHHVSLCLMYFLDVASNYWLEQHCASRHESRELIDFQQRFA